MRERLPTSVVVTLSVVCLATNSAAGPIPGTSWQTWRELNVCGSVRPVEVARPASHGRGFGPWLVMGCIDGRGYSLAGEAVNS